MLGKRFRRTSSMTGITVHLGDIDAMPPPPAPGVMIGGKYDHLLSPIYFQNNSPVHIETADFLRSCGLCNSRLIPGHDIYMYRGDTAFCSLECREKQMKHDERKERRAAAAAKGGESRRSEMVAGSSGKPPQTGTVVAA